MMSTVSSIFKLPATNHPAAWNWRRLFPSPFRLYGRLALTFFADLRTGVLFRMARPSSQVTHLPHALTVSQPVFANNWRENKLHNFRLAAERIQQVTIKPGGVFSFWKIVGRPTASKGYKPGRNLVVGQVRETIGGGLCQVSGILYHLSLIGNLAVFERHNHSVDLYANGEPRFTPLGADATIAYGYKDLRIANPYPFVIRFEFEVTADALIAHLRSEKPIAAHEVSFRYSKQEDRTLTVTLRNLPTGDSEVVAQSDYLLPKQA